IKRQENTGKRTKEPQVKTAPDSKKITAKDHMKKHLHHHDPDSFQIILGFHNNDNAANIAKDTDNVYQRHRRAANPKIPKFEQKMRNTKSDGNSQILILTKIITIILRSVCPVPKSRFST
ncbi:MAG: hypothetical protein IJU77_00845, partial [Butyrivibrio sp.]|nr:hypothetical protein [Butyrivibrio sp.]